MLTSLIFNLDEAARQSVLSYALGYFIVAGILLTFHFTMKDELKEINSDQEFEKLAD